MTIDYRVLGEPGRDNALLVTVDSGQSLHRLLFDCGEGCLTRVPVAQIQEIEALFFSHFHIDHIAGFDTFLRMNWRRPHRPVRVFGPPGAIEVLHHRLRGYTWNLVEDAPGEWLVTEIGENELRTSRFLASEGFANEHVGQQSQRGTFVYRGACFQVQACTLKHGIPCLAYVVREDDLRNVDTGRLRQLGLPPGLWLQALKDTRIADDARTEVEGRGWSVGELREQLLRIRPGDSIAYLTDFMLESSADEDRVIRCLANCRTMVCENNYSDSDADLARKNYHMTSSDVGRLAARVKPEKLVLFHMSDRYTAPGWRQQLEEARRQFDRAEFPEQWSIG